jgi:NAD(P) transhydrogenase
MSGALALGKLTSPLFMGSAFTAGLAGLIGYRSVWGVIPALHSPLMSVTNAISGIVGVGGFFIMGGGYVPETLPQAMGALSVLLAFVNVSGGFVITKRMLDMFKRPTDPPEYPWLYAIPGALFGGGFIVAASTGMAGLVQAGYLVSSLLCIGEFGEYLWSCQLLPTMLTSDLQDPSKASLLKQQLARATYLESWVFLPVSLLPWAQ